MDHIGPFTFLAVRNAMAVPFLMLVVFFFDSNKKEYWKLWMDKKLWKAGIFCGVALFVAAGLQQIGLVYTSAGKSGFLTAMYIVLVPVLGLFRKKMPPINVWFSVALAVAGLYLLSCVGVSQINVGDILLLGCALAFAVQIILIDEMGGELDGLRLNCIQSLVVAVVGSVCMFLFETPSIEGICVSWLPIGYAAILSTGVAYSLQIVGQKHIHPAVARILMSLESVFAVIGGFLILHQALTPKELLGCALIFAAVLTAQKEEKNTAGTL
jgi:drug/metabolite transporter (DMT)-like permease